jgi:hypothetical protein
VRAAGGGRALRRARRVARVRRRVRTTPRAQPGGRHRAVLLLTVLLPLFSLSPSFFFFSRSWGLVFLGAIWKLVHSVEQWGLSGGGGSYFTLSSWLGACFRHPRLSRFRSGLRCDSIEGQRKGFAFSGVSSAILGGPSEARRSLAPQRVVRLHLHPQQEQRQAKAEAPASSDVEAESDPTGNWPRNLRAGVFGAGMREPAIEATCGAGDADATDLSYLPPACRPCTLSVTAGCYAMFSLSFASQDSQHARGGRGKTAARSGRLPLLPWKFSRVTRLTTRDAVRAQCYGMAFASGPDEARRDPMLRPKPG